MSDLFPDTLLGLDAQIAEVRREMEMRERNYPDFVRRGIVTKARADRQMAAMRAVLNTLETLKAGGAS